MFSLIPKMNCSNVYNKVRFTIHRCSCCFCCCFFWGGAADLVICIFSSLSLCFCYIFHSLTTRRDVSFLDGMKELKVFVDMALNYVGDDPKEMDKVRHLRAVITGYAPLIFQTGSEMTFLDRCCEVARNIKADRELPAKLVSQSHCPQRFLSFVCLTQTSGGSPLT